MDSSKEDFEEFVRARTPSLLRVAYLLTGDQHLAEDLVQSALARSHQAWGRARVDNPHAYVRRTMYHLQVSWWRRRRFTESALSSDEGAVGGDDSTLTTVRIDLKKALLSLPPKQRAVVVLRFFEDQSEAETAQLLDCAVGTVKSQTAKALAKLRVLVPEYGVAGVKNR